MSAERTQEQEWYGRRKVREMPTGTIERQGMEDGKRRKISADKFWPIISANRLNICHING